MYVIAFSATVDIALPVYAIQAPILPISEANLEMTSQPVVTWTTMQEAENKLLIIYLFAIICWYDTTAICTLTTPCALQFAVYKIAQYVF
jgi:hypothetical protein